jgi:hypothetical protein
MFGGDGVASGSVSRLRVLEVGVLGSEDRSDQDMGGDAKNLNHFFDTSQPSTDAEYH